MILSYIEVVDVAYSVSDTLVRSENVPGYSQQVALCFRWSSFGAVIQRTRETVPTVDPSLSTAVSRWSSYRKMSRFSDVCSLRAEYLS